MKPKESINELEDIYQNGFVNDLRICGTDKILDAIRDGIEALEKLEYLKWLMKNYLIRLDHYDTEHGNKDFVLYVLDVLNGEISVDIEALSMIIELEREVTEDNE